MSKNINHNSLFVGSIFTALTYSIIGPCFGLFFFLFPYIFLTFFIDLNFLNWLYGSYDEGKNLTIFPYLKFFLSSYLFLLLSNILVIEQLEKRLVIISRQNDKPYSFDIKDRKEKALQLLKITIFSYILGYILWRIATLIIDVVDYIILGNSYYTDLISHISYGSIYDDFLKFGIDSVGWGYLLLFHYLQYLSISYIYHKKCEKLFGKETVFLKDPFNIES